MTRSDIYILFGFDLEHCCGLKKLTLKNCELVGDSAIQVSILSANSLFFIQQHTRASSLKVMSENNQLLTSLIDVTIDNCVSMSVQFLRFLEKFK